MVLNACYSDAQAAAIASQVDVLIGMRSKIKDGAAVRFAEAFYQGLAQGRTVGTAFDLGVNALELDADAPSAEIPVMRSGDGVDPYQLAFAPDSLAPSRWRTPGFALGAVAALGIGVYFAIHRDPGPPVPPGRYDCRANDRLMADCEVARVGGRFQLVFSTPESNDVLVHRMEGEIRPAEEAGCWRAEMTTTFWDGIGPVNAKPGGTITGCRDDDGWTGSWSSTDGAIRDRFQLTARRGTL